MDSSAKCGDMEIRKVESSMRDVWSRVEWTCRFQKRLFTSGTLKLCNFFWQEILVGLRHVKFPKTKQKSS